VGIHELSLTTLI